MSKINSYSSPQQNIYKIICYIRRSRQDIERENRTGEDTLATQKRIMIKVLDDLSIPYDQVLEIGSGDKIETRPVFQQVLEDLKIGTYNAISVKEIARLGRGSYSDMGVIYDLFFGKNIYIITPYKIYDPSNPSDARQIRFELFISREEFLMIKERLLSAKCSLAHTGCWMAGNLPYAYKLNSQTSKLEPIEELADIVRLIFILYVNGIDGQEVSFRAIATYLTRIGIHTPKNGITWEPSTVKRILSNPVYNGTVMYYRRKRVMKDNKSIVIDRPLDEHIIVEHAHESIIDEETWELAQKKFNNRGTAPHNKLDFSPCELAGLIICSKCKKTMIKQTTRTHYDKKDGTRKTYFQEVLWCTKPGCSYAMYRRVEENILLFLDRLKDMGIEEAKKLLEDDFNKFVNNKKENSVDINDVMSKKELELKRKLKFAYEKWEDGLIDDNMYKERTNELNNELNKLKLLISNENVNNNNFEQKFFEWQDKVKTVLEAYKICDDKTEKNGLLKSVIIKIEFERINKKDFKIRITPSFYSHE